MPIRINLLAEAQALEDMRRRDPVKRVFWVGLCLVILMLAWSSSLQLKAMIAKGDLNRVQGQLSSRTNEYRTVLQNQQKLSETTHRLLALQQLATNRMLYGTFLNALQQSTLDDVQLLKMRVDQTYAVSDEVKPKTNADNHITPGRPATSTERTVLTFEAVDSGVNPGDQVNKYKQALTANPYFLSRLATSNDVRLVSLSAPQVREGKPCVLFTLECRYQEKTR